MENAVNLLRRRMISLAAAAPLALLAILFSTSSPLANHHVDENGQLWSAYHRLNDAALRLGFARRFDLPRLGGFVLH